jgi:hypothetical protein
LPRLGVTLSAPGEVRPFEPSFAHQSNEPINREPVVDGCNYAFATDDLAVKFGAPVAHQQSRLLISLS